MDGVFGQFSHSWGNNGATSNKRRLKDWLDPNSTSATTLDGGTFKVCNPPNLNIVVPTTTSSTYQAGISITASSAINSGLSVNYIAGTDITLSDGFSTGADFSATISPCYQVSAKTGTNPKPATDKAFNGLASFEVYPNPTSDRIAVSMTFDKTGTASLELYDLQGRLVTSLWRGRLVDAKLYNENFDIGNVVSDGTYILRLSTTDCSESIRIVKSSY